MLKQIGVIVVLGMLSGCALGLEHIDIAYKPTAVAQPVLGADRVLVELSVSTKTSPPTERVGVKKNGYGMEMGGLAATRPVAEIVRSAFATELAGRGFPLRASNTKAAIKVTRFVNDYKTGFFTIGSEADVTLAVSVRSETDGILYAKTVTGKGIQEGALAGTPSLAREAFEKALPDAVSLIVSDPDFIKALFTASRIEVAAAPSS